MTPKVSKNFAHAVGFPSSPRGDSKNLIDFFSELSNKVRYNKVLINQIKIMLKVYVGISNDPITLNGA